MYFGHLMKEFREIRFFFQLFLSHENIDHWSIFSHFPSQGFCTDDIRNVSFPSSYLYVDLIVSGPVY